MTDVAPAKPSDETGIPGLLEAGNIDLAKRPSVPTPEGTATVRSMSFNENGREVLIPTVSDDGKIMSDEDAKNSYRKTKKYLGIFDTPENATKYAIDLHKQQEGQLKAADDPMSGKSWTEIEIDPKFRSQPAEVREAVRQRFYDRIAHPRMQAKNPKMSEQETADSRKMFDAFTRESPMKTGDYVGAAQKGDTGYVQDIDYMSGVDFGPLKKFFEADNDRERFKTLSGVYGKDNVGIDPGGRWFVRDKDGKMKSVVGWNAFKNLGAEGAAQAPELAMMGAGAALAPETGGLSLAPAVTRVAAKYGLERGVPFLIRQAQRLEGLSQLATKTTPVAAGAVTGKLVQDAEKAADGRFDQSTAEFTKNLAKEAFSGYLGDAGFRSMTAAGRRMFLDLYSKGLPLLASPASQMEKEMAARALREGFQPSVGQARGETGGAALWRYGQKAFELVSGGAQKREGQNYAAINKKLDDFMDSIGVSPAERAEFKERVLSKDFAIRDAIEGIGTPTQKTYERLGAAIDEQLGKAQKSLTAETDRLINMLGKEEHPILALDTERAIDSARTTFGNIANGRYGEIWALGGEGGVNLPTGAIKKEAADVWSQIAKTAPDTEAYDVMEKTDTGFRLLEKNRPKAEAEPAGTAVNTKLDGFKAQVKRIMEMPDQMPIQQMAQLRTDFMKAAEDPTLTPGPEKGRYRTLANSITDLMKVAEKDTGLSAEAARKLRETNEWYGSEISKFDVAKLIRLAKDPGAPGAARAEDIPGSIIQPGYESTMNQIKAVVGKDIFDRIASKRFDELKTMAIDDKTQEISASKLASVLGKYTKDGFARKVWGEKTGKEIEQLQREAHALGNESIDPKTLTPGTIRESIRAAVANKQAHDAYWTKNIMGELAAGGERQEAAVNRVAEMRNLSDIKMVKLRFGESSPEFNKTRQLAMQKVLSQAVEHPDSPFGQALTGKGFLATLTNVGRDKLTEMFGRDLTEDLFNLANHIRYVTAKDNNPLAGALRAGTLMFHPISHLPGLAQTYIEGNLMLKPGFVKWITYGLEGDGRFANAVANTFRLAAYEFGQEASNLAYPQENEYNRGQPSNDRNLATPH